MPLFRVDIFKSLIDALKANNYSGTDIFVFPYDWRLNLKDTIIKLEEKIQDIKYQNDTQKIDIVAHSMGGLLIKDYIREYGDSSIDKLIFVGTPHIGAPKAGKTILEGDRLGIPWLNTESVKTVAQNSPALYQLIPNEKYFNIFQGYLKQLGFNNEIVENH